MPLSGCAPPVITFPGLRLVEHAGPGRWLVRHGYGVLLVDMRGTGESDGDLNAFGWSARRPDVEAALDFLVPSRRRPEMVRSAVSVSR